MISSSNGLRKAPQPKIIFNYISPLNTSAPLLYTTSHAISNPSRIGSTSKTSSFPSIVHSHRRRIFDSSYKCKDTILRAYSLEATQNLERRTTLYSSANIKKRNMIFAKKRAKQFSMPQQSKTTSASNRYKTLDQLAHRLPKSRFVGQLPTACQPIEHKECDQMEKANIISKVKIELSDSATSKSIKLEDYPRTNSEERFFDPQTPREQKRVQKLLDVNLYKSMTPEHLQQARVDHPTLFQKWKQYLKQPLGSSLNSFLLLLSGLAIFFLQLAH